MAGFALILIIDLMLIFALLSSGARHQGYQIDSPEKKKKRNAARARTERQVYEAEVNAPKSLDVRPRKIGRTIRGKTVVRWGE